MDFSDLPGDLHSPALRRSFTDRPGSCSFSVQTLFKSSREAKLLLFSISLTLSTVLFRRTSRLLGELQRRSRMFHPQPRWRRRHRSSPACAHAPPFSLCFNSNWDRFFCYGDFRQGPRSYPYEMLKTFQQCAMQRSCTAAKHCSLPLRFVFCHISFSFEFVLVQSFQCAMGFCWIFLEEVEWPGRLQKLKLWIVKVGSRCGR